MGVFGYSTIRTTFEEIKLKASKTAKCSKCGKRVKRQTTFFQTMNPFNKNKDGIPKNENEILNELQKEKEDWLKKEVVCCEEEED